MAQQFGNVKILNFSKPAICQNLSAELPTRVNIEFFFTSENWHITYVVIFQIVPLVLRLRKQIVDEILIRTYMGNNPNWFGIGLLYKINENETDLRIRKET